MKPVVIGKSGGRKVVIDLRLLLRTRMLVTANSGGGKSWDLRLMAEQLFGKVPVQIVDPEGEFASLREKFGFLLVGKGGETPADVRTAPLLAETLRRENVSVVFDLYDLKPPQRHAWVRAYFGALMNLPKSLWRPMVLMLDEAHKFAPEKGTGESEASGEVQDVATRGRKRGICLIAYTQRLANISKTVTAELLNRMVGMTREDVDIERSLKVLSVTSKEKEQIELALKKLKAGEFYGLGPAISNDRILISVGPVQTSHPEVGEEISDTPPPTPDKVKALLPKLSDLPKQAEEKAVTEREMKAEIRSLKAQLATRPQPAPPPKVAPAKTVTKEISVIKAKDLVRLERAMNTADRAAGKIQDALGALRGFADQIRGSVKTIEQKARGALVAPAVPPRAPASFERPVAKPAPVVRPAANGSESDGELDKPQKKILVVLAQYPEGCVIGKLALLTGYRVTGGFRNALGALRTKGYMNGVNTGVMTATERGIDALGSDYTPLPEGADLTNYWRTHPSFGTCEQKILGALLENPDGMTLEQLAEATGYGITGGFRNATGALRTAGVLVGKNTETMKASPDLLGVEAR